MKKVALLLFVGLILKTDLVKGNEVEANPVASNENSTVVIVKPAQNTQQDTQVEQKQASPAIAYSQSHSSGDASEVFEARSSGYHQGRPASIIPMLGGTGFVSRWGDHVGNQITTGLAIDLPMTHNLSFELEGSYAKSNISYSANQPHPGNGWMWKHDFNQWLLGSNVKYYLLNGTFRPFIAPGITMVHYTNMSRGPRYQNAPSYNHTLGAGQLSAGTDIGITEDVEIGFRLSYLQPLINRPFVVHNGRDAAPGFEEASAMNNAFYRVMGSVKFAL